MKRIILYLFITFSSISIFSQNPVFPLHASQNGRYLVDSKNKPFFYQAETPWLIFINLNEKDMGELMDIRIKQGFTVIQTMALTTGVNVNGDKPFENNDFTKPNLAYFEHLRASYPQRLEFSHFSLQCLPKQNNAASTLRSLGFNVDIAE